MTLYSLLFQQNVSPYSMSLYNAICSLQKCNDTLISSTLSSFKIDCASDIATNNPYVYVVELLFTFYSPLISSYCFKNSTGGSCIFKYWEDYALYAGAGTAQDDINNRKTQYTAKYEVPDTTNAIFIKKLKKGNRSSEIDYIPTPGTNSEAKEAAAEFKS
ncbi:9789_t:CDS:2 [Dentiscutata erythropus]|uniref:9789_t:CDS:1 n=1 Tax=Dentiscutata erythropus TaxID=1348616 RepID=A0A9N9AHN3_9GLOM|nr:9789_t:CDS:2 [Dentiscutata erythropus]